MSEKVCQACKHYQSRPSENGNPASGFCKRNPPTPIAFTAVDFAGQPRLQVDCIWPVVAAIESGCGEFKPGVEIAT